MLENLHYKIPLISIVIPVKNGVNTLASCLSGIMNQTMISVCEIIIIDSGSTDGTLGLLKNYPVDVYQIPPSEFNHGDTRNYGVSLAKGEFVVMTVQDATPADEFWLERMYRHFADKQVAGVCGQQIVPHHSDKNPHQWFRPQSEGGFRKVFFEDGEFEKLTPEAKKKECSWDDVTAMYRKEFLMKIPFQPVMFGEDMIWAKEALIKGMTLVYDTTARVEHYHHHYPEYTFKRVLIVWLFIYKTFGFVRANPISIRDFFLVFFRNFKWGLSPKWIIHNLSFLFYFSKAVNHFNVVVAKSEIGKLENELSISIPQGTV